MLENEYKFFKDNLPELLKEYSGRFLVIKEQKIIENFPTYDEALAFGLSQFKLGEFLIQECIDIDAGKLGILDLMRCDID